MTKPNWDDILRKQAGDPTPAARARLDELCAAVFITALGVELLKEMRAQTIDKRSPARAHEAQLREDEAVRRFVRDLEDARDRGLAARTKAP